MHPGAGNFIRRARAQIENYLPRSETNKFDAVEVGSRDINGRASDYWGEHGSWLGVDIAPGPGADIVGHGAVVLDELHGEGRRFDLSVSCEVFEHTEDWPWILGSMARVSQFIIMTCASIGRAPHSAVDGGYVRNGEHYANVTSKDFGREMIYHQITPLLMEHDVRAGDLYFLGAIGFDKN